MRYVRLRANAILQREWLLTREYATPRVRDPAEAIAVAVFRGEAKRSLLLEKERATVKTPTAFRTRFVSKQ